MAKRGLMSMMSRFTSRSSVHCAHFYALRQLRREGCFDRVNTYFGFVFTWLVLVVLFLPRTKRGKRLDVEEQLRQGDSQKC
jgi:hypothetical protein